MNLYEINLPQNTPNFEITIKYNKKFFREFFI